MATAIPRSASYGDAETASDIVALVRELGGPAVIVGNSMGAGAAVIAAADHPELVSGLVLVGPFVRNGSTSGIQKLLFRVAMAPLWGPAVWKSYLPKLYAGQRPDDFEAYRRQVVASLRQPGTPGRSHAPRTRTMTSPRLVSSRSRRQHSS